ncbi:MAG: hypothetical protein C4589_05575 [Peptococcaceae bacterium]|nr:MAG: hypothetical protein C4589_05575 [Peptococcaceae bacterium]
MRITREKALENWRLLQSTVLYQKLFESFEEYWEACVRINEMPDEEFADLTISNEEFIKLDRRNMLK